MQVPICSQVHADPAMTLRVYAHVIRSHGAGSAYAAPTCWNLLPG